MGEQEEQYQHQQITLQYVISHHKLTVYLLYVFSCICYGMTLTCLGPMFPYLSYKQNRLETQYSFLFTSRALGFIVGAISVKFVQNKFTLHHFLAIGTFTMGTFSILFYFSDSMLLKNICIFISSIGCAYHQIAANLAVLIAFHNDNSSLWIQMIHGFFGIGGLAGPFIVYLFQLKSIMFIGMLAVLASTFYMCVQSPQHREIQKKQLHHNNNSNNNNNIINNNNDNNSNNNNNHNYKQSIPNSSLYILYLLFFCAIGQQLAYSSWISSYAVLFNFSTKEHATMYSSLYWVSIAIFRFILATIKSSPSYKIQIFMLIGVIISIVSYIIIFYIDHQVGLIFMTILYGFCNSAIYALLLGIPQQFGYRVNIKHTTNFIIWGSLGQGCLAVGIGEMMEWFSFNWLIYGICIIDLAVFILVKYNVKIMTEHKQQHKSYSELLLQNKKQNAKHSIKQMIQLKEVTK